MRKCYLIFLFLFLPYLSSCGLLRKTKVVTRTVIETHVDTLVKIKVDTIAKYKTVYLHDTAYLDNKYSKARSYYDTTLKKIVLSLQEKPFEIKVTFNKKESTTNVTKTVEKHIPVWIWIIGVFVVLFLIFFWIWFFKFIYK